MVVGGVDPASGIGDGQDMKVIYGLGLATIVGVVIYNEATKVDVPKREASVHALAHDPKESMPLWKYYAAVKLSLEGERTAEVTYGEGRTVVIRTKNCSTLEHDFAFTAASPPNAASVECYENRELYWRVVRE